MMERNFALVTALLTLVSSDCSCSVTITTEGHLLGSGIKKFVNTGKYITFEPEKVVLNYGNNADLSIRIQPEKILESLAIFIIYPCGIISSTLSQNHSDEVSVHTTPHHHHRDDHDLRRLANRSEDDANADDCAFSLVYEDLSKHSFEGSVLFRVRYEWVGMGLLRVHVWENEKNISQVELQNSEHSEAEIIVGPPPYKFGIFPTMAIFIGFSFNIFGFALTVKRPEVAPYLMRPIILLLLLFSQFLLWPALGMIFNLLLDPPSYFQFMFLSICAASSGAFTNLFSILTNARLNLNVLSLVLCPILGIGFIPLWVNLLGMHLLTSGHPLFHSSSISSFPWLLFLVLKAIFIIPGILGFIGGEYFPKQARMLSLVLRPLAILFVAAMMVLALIDHAWSLVYITLWRVALGPVLLPVVGGLLIFGLSFVVVRNSKSALTITIQTIVPNPAYALLFSIVMVPKPYNSVCIALGIIYFLTIVLITLVTSSSLALFRFVRSRKDTCLLTKSRDVPVDVTDDKVIYHVEQGANAHTAAVNSTPDDFVTV